MFDLSWTEILLIGTAAIIFIGPKELPNALRTAGQWAGKARGLAREFQSSLDDLMREAEIEELKRQAQTARNLDLKGEAAKMIDPSGTLKNAFEVPSFNDTGATGHPGSPPEEAEGQEAMVDLPVRPRTPPSAAKAYEPPPASSGTDPMIESATEPPPAAGPKPA